MPPVVMHPPVMLRLVTHPHVTLPRVMHLHAMLRLVTHPHVTLRHRGRIRSFNSSGEISWGLPFCCTHGVVELWHSTTPLSSCTLNLNEVGLPASSS